MSGSRVLVSDQIIDRAPHNISEHSAHPQICFTRQLWQRTMTDENDQSTTASISQLPRVSIGSSIASGSKRPDRAASLSSLVTTSHPPTPRTPNRSSLPAVQSPISSARKRSAEDDDHDAHILLSSPKCGPDTSPYPCLCQPEPKIPRPRNAFILYRQHHNASVITRYPHLSNPEISKIIGELWRNETEEEKQKWKVYAEEDKAQHQQKYPLYRYQPKRSNKGSTGSDGSPSPWTDVPVCPKCNGRKVAQPHATPTASLKTAEETVSNDTASTLPRRSNTITLPPPKPSNTNTPSTRFLPMQNLSLDSPSSARFTDRGLAAQSHARDDHRNAWQLPGSPKRRRVDPYSHPHPATPLQQMTAVPRLAPNSLPPISVTRNTAVSAQGHNRRISLPPASEIMGNHSHHMAPPPRPAMGYGQHRSLIRRGPAGRDLSLDLPPLQTGSAHVRPGPSTAGLSTAAASSVPPTAGLRGFGNQTPAGGGGLTSLGLVRHKIGTLRQLLLPCSSTDDFAVRGAIVAVEGESAVAARELADWLGEQFASEADVDVTVMDGPRVPAEVEIKTEQLLDTVKAWHGRSRDVIDIVTRQGARRASVGMPQTGINSTTQKLSSSTTTSGGGASQGEKRKDSASSSGSTMSIVPPSPAVKKGMVILRSYVLTATNLFAARLPIVGKYDPKGHWEWVACLWRGLVAPDIIIYVKDVESEEQLEGSGVEVLEDGKLVIVKRVKKNDTQGADSTGIATSRAEAFGVQGMPAGTLRRLGFEVGEWLRGFHSSSNSVS